MKTFFIAMQVLFVASVLAFCLFGCDKHLAVYNRRRVPEFLLFLIAFLGGAFGALCGMIFFSHKTRHNSFLVAVPLFLLLQLTFVVLLRYGVL